MKTPFDSALRVQRRAMDEIRIELRAENEMLSTVNAAHAAVETRLRREAELSTNDFSVVSFAFADRLRAQRRGFKAEQVRVGGRLDAMRGVALEASGRLRAIEVAAEEFGGSELRREAGLAQAEADDLAGSRLARARTAHRSSAMASAGQ